MVVIFNKSLASRDGIFDTEPVNDRC